MTTHYVIFRPWFFINKLVLLVLFGKNCVGIISVKLHPKREMTEDVSGSLCRWQGRCDEWYFVVRE